MNISTLFGLRLQNIPLINLRLEFNHHFKLLSDPTFREEFSSSVVPIQTKYLIWNGMPDAFLTLIAQRAILGVESYLPSAVTHQAAKKGILIKTLRKRLITLSAFVALVQQITIIIVCRLS